MLEPGVTNSRSEILLKPKLTSSTPRNEDSSFKRKNAIPIFTIAQPDLKKTRISRERRIIRDIEQKNTDKRLNLL